MPSLNETESYEPPLKPEITPAESLPDVTPPGAGFILQLFLIPLIIVSVIVMLYLMFSWFAHQGGNPVRLAAEINRGGHATWQKAATLADLLRNTQYDHLKDDHELAAQLAIALEGRLVESDEENIRLCIFLCRALGEFRVDDGLPPICQAAGEASPPELRRTALEAIALLASKDSLGPQRVRTDSRVMTVLMDAASARTEGDDPTHEYDNIRQTAAFALGVVGGEEALERLAVMLSDAYPNARYNAATGLARNGDARASDGLLEMLDPENPHAVSGEESEYGAHFKRGLVIINAVRAVERLARVNPSADLGELVSALEKLQSSDIEKSIKLEAREVVVRLDQADK